MITVKLGGPLVAAALSLAFAGNAFAAQTVNVSLGGEAGSPMTIKLDATSIKAGEVLFNVKNDAYGTDHEVVLVRLKSKDQKIAVVKSKDKVDEKKLKTLGEVGGLKPGDTGTLKAKLAAGDYVLMCNHKGHYAAGMYTPFTVTK
jgi:uncharacterized cupredoxin-like copper-binding protein